MAHAICLRLLSARSQTRAQLASAMARRHVPAEAADRVLDRLAEVGLVDDQAFATAWVSSRHAGRGLAGRALAAELRQRGVDPQVVAEAVDTLDEEAELATARTLADRRLAATRGLPPATRLRRVVGQLARKGYRTEVALRMTREALAAEDRAAEPAAATGPATVDRAGSPGRSARHRAQSDAAPRLRPGEPPPRGAAVADG